MLLPLLLFLFVFSHGLMYSHVLASEPLISFCDRGDQQSAHFIVGLLSLGLLSLVISSILFYTPVLLYDCSIAVFIASFI